jgi:uncharacterized protein with von Willebrand factor type A (vWA) domain
LLFEPAWKSVRKDRPALIAVCDISGSVSAYARFLLLFLYSLGDVLPRVRSFVFSSQLAEVTPLFADNPPEVAVEMAQRQYGRRFDGLRGRDPRPARRHRARARSPVRRW